MLLNCTPFLFICSRLAVTCTVGTLDMSIEGGTIGDTFYLFVFGLTIKTQGKFNFIDFLIYLLFKQLHRLVSDRFAILFHMTTTKIKNRI